MSIEKQPEICFVTFQTLEGQLNALKQLGVGRNKKEVEESDEEMEDCYKDMFEVSECQSPHSINWENLFVGHTYRLIAGSIYLIIIGLYLWLITWVMANARRYFESIFFYYGWELQCNNIDQEFVDNQADYQYWAGIDNQYVWGAQSTGIL